MSNRYIAAFVTGLLLSMMTPGLATGAENEAKTLFTNGVTHFEAQRYDEAVIAFRAANKLNPSWKLLYNIGQCEAALKHYDLALEAFEHYLADGGDDVPADRQTEVMSEVTRLRNMTGFLELSGLKGDTILINGIARGKLPEDARLRLSMGKAQVQVMRGIEMVLERPIEIYAGDTASLKIPDTQSGSIEDEGPETDNPVSGSAPESGSKKKRIWTWVAFGVGGASAIGAGITGGLAISKRGDIEDQCENSVCPKSLEEDDNTTNNLAVTTDVLIGVAVVGIGAGILFYFLEPKWSGEAEIVASPTVGRDHAGLAITGRF